MIRLLIQSFKLLMLLGPRQALRFLIARKTGRNSVSLRPLGYPYQLECRTFGSDIFVMWQVFGKDDCKLPKDLTPKVILDGGANAGFTTARFAERFPNSIIIAVEPDSENVSFLRKNTVQFPNVRIIQAGLWKKDSFLEIENPDGQSWAFRVIESNHPTSIEGITVSTALERCGVKSADVVKLDIEGSEREIFAEGCLDWLSDCKLIIIETHGEAARKAVINAVDNAFLVNRQGEKLLFSRK